jgi:hypothetical protein
MTRPLAPARPLALALAVALLASGCIANPTPHPSVADEGGGFGTPDADYGGPGSDVVPGLADAGAEDATPTPLPDAAGGVDGPDANGAADAGADAGGGWEIGTPCGDQAAVGAFEIGHWGFYAAITGEVADGVVPLTVLQPVQTVGDCTMMQKDNPLCDPACAGGELCDHDGTCVPYPATLDVGTLSVSGLLVDASLTPNVVGQYAKTDVPFPLFAPGAAITLSATGGELAPFTLSAWGVADLVVATDPPLTLASGQPLTVTWTPSAGPGRIHMALNVDQHGNSPVTLVCTVADTGAATVPAELVTALLDFGVSGFASFDLYRRTVDSVTLAPGCVELRVFSYAQGKLVVAGHTACTKDGDCPSGQTCDLALNTCVGARR